MATLCGNLPLLLWKSKTVWQRLKQKQYGNHEHTRNTSEMLLIQDSIGENSSFPDVGATKSPLSDTVYK